MNPKIPLNGYISFKTRKSTLPLPLPHLRDTLHNSMNQHSHSNTNLTPFPRVADEIVGAQSDASQVRELYQEERRRSSAQRLVTAS